VSPMRLTPEQLAARKRRNLAIAGALVAFIVLIFVTTVLNLKRNIETRQAGELPVAGSTR
jgi:hypothetical protein